MDENEKAAAEGLARVFRAALRVAEELGRALVAAARSLGELLARWVASVAARRGGWVRSVRPARVRGLRVAYARRRGHGWAVG